MSTAAELENNLDVYERDLEEYKEKLRATCGKKQRSTFSQGEEKQRREEVNLALNAQIMAKVVATTSRMSTMMKSLWSDRWWCCWYRSDGYTLLGDHHHE